MILHLVYANSYVIGAHELFRANLAGEECLFIDFSNQENIHQAAFLQLDGTIHINQIDKEWWQKTNKHKGDESNKIFIHYLDYQKAKFASQLNKFLAAKMFWIYYGADLHSPLQILGKRDILDPKTKVFIKTGKVKKQIRKFAFRLKFRVVKNIIRQLDGFCHWDINELKLLQEHFHTPARYIYFRYFGGSVESAEEYVFPSNDKLSVLINHSGSLNGNHLTVIEKLSQLLDIHKSYKVIIPLSYGEKTYMEHVKRKANLIFNQATEYWEDRVSKEEYLARLAKTTVAIFGHRREEGAGNINLLLSCGVKVFLRRDNNHLKYLKDKGYFVFSFEDIKSMQDFTPLTLAQKEHNRNLHLQEFSLTEKEQVFKKLIQS